MKILWINSKASVCKLCKTQGHLNVFEEKVRLKIKTFMQR